MGAFGQGPTAFMSSITPFMQPDPGSAAGAAFAPPNKPAASPPTTMMGRLGAFGRGVGNYLTPDRLQLFAAALQRDPNAFGNEQLRQQQRNLAQWTQGVQQQALDRENTNYKYQVAGQDRSMQGLAEMRAQIAQSHPELLGAFDADPQGFLQTYIQQQMPAWKTDGTRLYRPLPNGRVQLGDPIPFKPNLASIYQNYPGAAGSAPAPTGGDGTYTPPTPAPPPGYVIRSP